MSEIHHFTFSPLWVSIIAFFISDMLAVILVGKDSWGVFTSLHEKVSFIHYFGIQQKGISIF